MSTQKCFLELWFQGLVGIDILQRYLAFPIKYHFAFWFILFVQFELSAVQLFHVFGAIPSEPCVDIGSQRLICRFFRIRYIWTQHLGYHLLKIVNYCTNYNNTNQRPKCMIDESTSFRGRILVPEKIKLAGNVKNKKDKLPQHQIAVREKYIQHYNKGWRHIIIVNSVFVVNYWME